MCSLVKKSQKLSPLAEIEQNLPSVSSCILALIILYKLLLLADLALIPR